MTESVVQIVPLRRFTRLKGLFDYSLPTGYQAQVGDLVEVPFKKSQVAGLVVSKEAKSYNLGKLKSVTRLLATGFINSDQLQLIKWQASHSGVSLATTAKLTVPFLPNSNFNIKPNQRLAKKQRTSNTKPINIVIDSAAKKITAVESLIDKVIKRQQQVLLLLPELWQVREWHERLAHKYSVEGYTGSDKLSRFRSAWLNIRNGEVQVIIGTRAALWLNFHNLGGIIVDEAENENFLQAEQNPRYDTLLTVKQLATYAGAALALISPAPRLENWYHTKKSQEDWRALGKKASKIEIIDLKVTPKAKGYKIISQDLISAVSKTLKQKKKVLLYLNRRGLATSSICSDCGFTALCSRCQRKLVVGSNEKYLLCYHCGTTEQLAVPCPKCGGSQINYGGTGIEQLAKAVKELWPEEKTAIIQDKFNDKHISQAHESSIIIGSRTAWRAGRGIDFGLIVLVNIDHELNLPEFRSVENVWQLSRNLSAMTEKLLIQTYQPDHYLWQALLSGELDNFYAKELAIRQKYGYPPFVQLIRLTSQSKQEALSLKQAETTKELLKKKLADKVTILGPYQDYFRLKGSHWRHHIIVKAPINFEAKLIWTLLPEDVIIDRNPWSILS